MIREDILANITPMAQQVFGDASLVLTEDSNAQTVDNWTSMNFMLFLTEIENAYSFKFKIFELMNIKDVRGIISAIEKHI